MLLRRLPLLGGLIKLIIVHGLGPRSLAVLLISLLEQGHQYGRLIEYKLGIGSCIDDLILELEMEVLFGTFHIVDLL